MARLSGLQREVLSLYRQCFREIRKKPLVRAQLIAIASNCIPLTLPQDSQENFKKFARYVFYLVFLIPHSQRRIFLPSPEGGPPFPGLPPRFIPHSLTRFSAEFQKHRSVNKKDFGAVEYLLRKGHRQLEMYASPGIRNIR